MENHVEARILKELAEVRYAVWNQTAAMVIIADLSSQNLNSDDRERLAGLRNFAYSEVEKARDTRDLHANRE